MVMPDARTRTGNDASGSVVTDNDRLRPDVPTPTVLMETEWATGTPDIDLREIPYATLDRELAGVNRLVKAGTILGATFTIRLGSHADT